MGPEHATADIMAGGFRFHSILFPGPDDRAADEGKETPDFFQDIFLDQVVEGTTGSWEEYDLGGFFRQSLSCLRRLDTIR